MPAMVTADQDLGTLKLIPANVYYKNLIS